MQFERAGFGESALVLELRKCERVEKTEENQFFVNEMLYEFTINLKEVY